MEIRKVGTDGLEAYARIPMIFRVETVLKVVEVDGGLGGLALIEEAVREPYMKDYDSEDSPLDLPKRFDVSSWAFFLAFDGEVPVGGATVAFGTPEVNLLESRTDLAVLWDIRIHPDHQRKGIGKALFANSARWAKEMGCSELKIETQNNNVPACRFYASQGCHLGSIVQHAYPKPYEDEVMLLWYLDL